jgi:NDP-sugar pyrophosphorylase family protein
MAVFENAGQWDASNTQVSDHRVIRYEKGTNDPACNHIDYGAIALRRSVFEELPEGVPFGLVSVQARLAAAGQLRAVEATRRFYEIGSERGLAELDAALRDGRVTW